MTPSHGPFGRFLRATGLCLAVAAALSPAAAFAEEKFPSKRIQVVIHTKYGGGTDTTARVMMIDTARELGVNMIVLSKRGGSGAKAHQYAASRPRDGYTVLALTQSHLYTIARGKSPLSIDDLVGVARAMDDPTLIAVSAKSPIRTLPELVAASRKRPLNWGIAIVGGTEHVGLVQFAKAADIPYKAVPFGSGGQMVQALMSGAVQVTLPNVGEAGRQIADGTIRPLAVMWPNRVTSLPNVASTYEFGYKVKIGTTRGYWVLKGTPQDRIETLSRAMVKAMRQEAFTDYLKKLGLDPQESIAGHRVWTQQIREEYAKAAAALDALGLR